MTEDRRQRVQEVFDEALARPPGERASFVAKACEGDDGLRAEVESLLKYDRAAPLAFMHPPARTAGPALRGLEPGPDLRAGERVGQYRIKRVIASGGMGTVYLAEQASPRRDVALKVMNTRLDSRSAVRRFEYESQILGRLRHPNIAQVYEAGTAEISCQSSVVSCQSSVVSDQQSVESRAARGQDREGILGPAPALERGKGFPREVGARRDSRTSGGPEMDGAVRAVPYFALEYVPDARGITEYAEQEALSTRQRLALFAQVCEAVHHGHQKGIIHRDLKPANILVDSSGQVKIIDFGVARSTDSDVAATTMQTDVGQIIGTLQYMSPEQCDADPHEIDTRSDVYSLGVVLYELLCGRLPYDLSNLTFQSAARTICEQAPARPSTITGRGTGVPPVDRDVETIALKALEKDRERRYQSAADLAQEIRRYLKGEPIDARPPTAWTSVARWMLRHPMIATAAACVTIALATLIATIVVKQHYVDWYLHTRPHEMRLSSDRREATLRSINGDIVRTWTAETPGRINFAELVERPAEFGGGRLALLGFTRSCGEPFRGSLCVFDAEDDLEEPIWKRRIELKDILPKLVANCGSDAEEYDLQRGSVIDVFPERPGEEIVLHYARGSHSQRVLRIYDLSGELLYEVWHDGAVGTPHWMANAGLLVFAGNNHEPYWDEYGKLLGEKVCDPVVFALRPVPGHTKDTNYLNDADRLSLGHADDPGSPVWYLRMWPEVAVDRVESIRLRPPYPPNDPGRYVRFEIIVGDQPQATVWWVIDERGNEAEGTRGWGDNYKSNRLRFSEGDDRRLPDPRQFKLGATAIEGDNALRRP